jgi:predicted acetyltransferase
LQNQFEIIVATLEQKPIVARLLQLYLYDASDYSGQDLNAQGRYAYPYLDTYWEDVDRFPYLFRVDGKWAGFGMVSPYVMLPENAGGTSLAEFFVMRKYRRRGIGRVAFRQLVARHPGAWEVRVAQENSKGRAFWPIVIEEVTGGDYQRMVLESSVWDGPIYRFDITADTAVEISERLVR